MRPEDPLKENKLFQLNTKEHYEGIALKKGTLRLLVSGIKTLLQPYQYDYKLILAEDNGILTGVRFEINIKNLR